MRQTLSVSDSNEISIPQELLPNDGRFGAGPSKVSTQALADLAATGAGFMGTSHRQAGVKSVVKRLQDGLKTLFDLDDGHEVILGNGGATLLWDALTFGFIEQRSMHLSFGEFGSKFAKAAKTAPHLSEPVIIEADPGTAPALYADDSVDVYAYTQNETSTGVMVDLVRPEGAEGLTCVDATSAAGGLRYDRESCDLYYFSPQKCFAADGGLYIAVANPAAVERIEKLQASDRWRPAGLDLGIALNNSRKNQTYNTPALATIFLTTHTVEWLNENGGLNWAVERCERSAKTIYDWAEGHELVTPFVSEPALRSNVVATIDLDDAFDANLVAKTLASNGVLDTIGYRKLGRNQLRIATFPAIEPEDVKQLTACIDFVLSALAK